MITSEWRGTELPQAPPFVARRADFLRRAGVSVDLVAYRGRQQPARYLQAWRHVRHLLAGGSYDLVHAQWGQSAILALPRKLPLIVTFQGSDLEGFVGQNGRYSLSGRLLPLLSAWVARHADQIILVSESLARHLPSRCYYHVIPGGLDLELFQIIPRAEACAHLGLQSEKKHILFAADPKNPIKRFALAQEAVARLEPQFDTQLVVASDVLHELIPIYMNACDVLILTSTHEGSPNIVKEALACDLPVVSVDVGDVRRRIEAIEGCVVCEDDGPETIASALMHVLKRNKRIAGRQTVLELDETLITPRVIAVYEQALCRR